MARKTLVLDEVLATLAEIDAPPDVVERFATRAEDRIASKARSTRRHDEITVTSGFGLGSQRGFVELALNDELTQMDPAKAREVGLMLIQASEAAIADEVFVTFLRDTIGITDAQKRALMLHDLREIRQGTRGVARPT